MEHTQSVAAAAPKVNNWVWGAGGSHGPGHLGVWKRARKLGLTVDEDNIFGVSVGAVEAAFITNGYTEDQVAEIFKKEIVRARRNPVQVMKSYNPFDPIGVAIGGFFRLLPFMRELVQKYNLKPNKRLRILACDHRHEPVIFEGLDYDLAVALSASGSPPGAFQPVWYMRNGTPTLLMDGAVYHYNPTEFTEGTCIVSKFRPATEWPKEFATPWDLYFHMREMFMPLAGNSRYVDETKHIVIECGLPDVAGLNLGISDATIDKMIENGYKLAGPVLEKAIADGRVALRK